MKTRSRPRSRRWLAALAFSAAVKTLTPSLHADALEHGFVEPCTLANVQEPELECEMCASAVGSPPCADRLSPRGFTKRCRTHGSHAGWDEIWCTRRPEPTSGLASLVAGAIATLGAMVLMLRVLTGKPAKG